ncbi:5-amino-6-(5-phosphoribosylamino)uracil reductase [Microcella alkaliphila]|uniref:5-amino-6-(5-phosphoribosylamino)uracil reductase n=1 Tax=Microcella alkaliphila TaxID=279828 RepID=A0A4Q7TTB9_9MICO|nr:dihydrofolate reductase family protein [Microcella alkaliphila]RZT64235.1 5-amino-6-(5-phosphoribosylamino)uracil reductase [Microcella alkaliphila]
MLLRRVLPSDGGVVDLASPDSDERLHDWYRPLGPGLRLMLISTLDGKTAGDDGTSASISSDTDRRVLRAVRSHADAIIIGAETVRREAIGPAQGSAIVVVSGSGALDGHRLAPSAAERELLVVTTPDGADRARHALTALPHEVVTLAAADDGRLDADAVVDAVRARGYTQLVCEGGPSLAHQFRASGLVDEWCLTVAPAIGGGTPLTATDSAVARLVPRQLLVDDEGFSYGRWAPEAG